MILITGANGLVGSFITRKLLSQGLKIRATRRSNSDLGFVEDIKDQIEWIEADIIDVLLLEEQMKDISWVIHCAGQVSFDKKDRQQLLKVNFEGTKNIVNACLKNGVEGLIFISSISTYAGKTGNEHISENSKRELNFMKSNYAESKYLAELEVWRGHMEGLKTIILNPSVVLGPSNWHNSSSQLFRYIWSEAPFYIKGWLNFTDVRDLADITLRLLQLKKSGVQYIISANKVSYEELFKKIAFHFDKKPPKYRATNWMLGFACLLDQTISFLTGKKAKITGELVKAAKAGTYFSSNKVKKELSFDFRSLDDTIRWTCGELKFAHKV
ncbi:MAG: SDR family NAD(P)-dependent oxidoreductase [Candidatus Cyclobacteriaceae bacterium M3_2C_046]